MNLISLKDYAAQKNISYEAVRQQVVRYKDELEEHIVRDGRQQFLDDEAVAFLDSKRLKNPVAIIQQSKDEAIDELKEKIEGLLVKTTEQAVKIAELSEWKAEKAMLIASAEQTMLSLKASEAAQKLLEESRDEYKAEAAQKAQEAAEEAQRAQELQKALEDAEKEKNDLQAEYEAYKALPWYKKIFGGKE